MGGQHWLHARQFSWCSSAVGFAAHEPCPALTPSCCISLTTNSAIGAGKNSEIKLSKDVCEELSNNAAAYVELHKTLWLPADMRELMAATTLVTLTLAT